MANSGYSYTAADGREFFVPEPEFLLCPVRNPATPYPGFPTWLVEFTDSGILYFRRFGDTSAIYSMMEVEDGVLEFRDVDIDTLMYTMTPLYDSDNFFDGYEIEWYEYTTDDRPDVCDLVGDVILPSDESGEKWIEFEIDLEHFIFPVYSVEDEVSEVPEDGDGDEDGDEEEEEETPPVFYLDVCIPSQGGSSCALWDLETEEPVVFRITEGDYDTQCRRVYSLAGIDGSLLFSSDGFVLYDGNGDRLGVASRIEHDDDESYDDVVGLATFTDLTLDKYIESFPSDSNRSRDEELRREVWRNAVDSAELCLDKLLCMSKMFLDASYEFSNPTLPVDTPLNFSREIENTEYSLYSTPDGYELRDKNSEIFKTVRKEFGEDSWTVYDTDGNAEYKVAADGYGEYVVSDSSGDVVYTFTADEFVSDFDENDYGEYSQTNKYSPVAVLNSDDTEAFKAARPVHCEDPFDSLTFAEFKDYIPLYKEGSEWLSHATKMQYYEVEPDNLNYCIDVYTRFNKFKCHIAKPELWDYADRDICDENGDAIAKLTLSSIDSLSSGDEVAKMYEKPEALYTYQLFDNKQGSYNYLTRYSNDLVVVVNQKGSVVCYVTPDLEYRSSTWWLFGTVEEGQVVDSNGDVLYTFSRRSGDYNIYDADGNLVGHLFSGTSPNNEWTIADGCQRLLTFLATESTVVVDSSGNYYFRTKDGETELDSRVEVQSNESGTLQLRILNEDGDEIYRITPSGTSYQVDHVNGVSFDTANAYETYSQGNMVLTRYWSVPYARMMYSCTNDQPEGTFDGLDGGSGNNGGPSPLSNDGSVSGVVSGSGRSSVYAVSGVPIATYSADSTSSSTTAEGGGGTLSADSIDDLIEQTSKYFDSVLGVLTKGNDTSKGEDLDPDNPLQISQTETDGRLLADAAFSNNAATPSEEMMLADTYDYTQAVTRLSKVYSSGRDDYYQEAQDYHETQVNRLEYKKAAFTSTMTMAKEAAENTGTAG